MGCDIHFVIEKNIGNKWLGIYASDEIQRGLFAETRNYVLFGEIANVRERASITGMYPRFLPSDASELSIYSAGKYGSDGHSHSWLTLSEFCDAALRVKDKFAGWEIRSEHLAYDLFRIEHEEGEEDLFRIIFWFDN